MIKKILLLYACIGYAMYTHNQTTVVYNVSNNTCSGTNMNCEGFVNSVGDSITWDTTDIRTVNITSPFSEPQKIQIDFPLKKLQAVYAFIPGTDSAKGKRIRVLFVKIPYKEYTRVVLPDRVAKEVADIVAEKGKDAPIKDIIKVYRQFSGPSNDLKRSEWVDVATLFIPIDSYDKLTVTLSPDGTATATSRTDDGKKIDLVIKLQELY